MRRFTIAFLCLLLACPLACRRRPTADDTQQDQDKKDVALITPADRKKMDDRNAPKHATDKQSAKDGGNPQQIAEPAGTDPYAGWQTVQGKDEDFEFTLRIPPGWRWAKGMIHQAIKHTGLDWSMSVVIGPDRLLAAKKKLSAPELLKHAVQQAAPTALGMPIVEQRVIKVGELDAAWVVFHEKQPGKSVPSNVETFCRLPTGRVEVCLDGGYTDIRAGKTTKDFENAQAELLKICQSFRVVGGQGGK